MSTEESAHRTWNNAGSLNEPVPEGVCSPLARLPSRRRTAYAICGIVCRTKKRRELPRAHRARR